MKKTGTESRIRLTQPLVAFIRRLCLTTVMLLAACELLPRKGDTEGEQQAARWEWSGRLVVDTDPTLTVVRMRVDTAGVKGRHDVVLARYDFDPAAGSGDEYSLTVGLDLGHAMELPVNTPLILGHGPPPAGLPAFATVTCLCRPLRPDSVRGTLTILQRGLRQITARIDARLYFTAWHDSTAHVVYPLRQKFFGVK